MATSDESPPTHQAMIQREAAAAVKSEPSKGVLKKTAKLASKSAGKTLRAFSFLTKSAAVSSAVSGTSSYKKSKGKLEGTSAQEFMVDRNYDLAKFMEDSKAGALASVTECWERIKKEPKYDEKAGLLLFIQ